MLSEEELAEIEARENYCPDCNKLLAEVRHLRALFGPENKPCTCDPVKGNVNACPRHTGLTGWVSGQIRRLEESRDMWADRARRLAAGEKVEELGVLIAVNREHSEEIRELVDIISRLFYRRSHAENLALSLWDRLKGLEKERRQVEALRKRLK